MLKSLLLRTTTAVLLVSTLGCGGSAEIDSVGGTYEPSFAASDGANVDLSLAPMQTSAGVQDTSGNENDARKLDRKIIYNATLDLVVDSFSDVAAGVEQLVQKYGAFVAKSQIDTASGRPRNGSWTIRVPATRYSEFLDAVGTLGELQRRTEDSREVTAEYYDLDTRIRNKRLEETRLLNHLQESTGQLEDILAIEKEIARVRTEMEQMEGQLRLLQDLTALSTVTLNVSEIKDFVPPESPTFSTQISRTWRRSLDGLVTAGRNAVIVAVAIAPWLVVIAPLAIICVLWRRRVRCRRLAVPPRREHQP